MIRLRISPRPPSQLLLWLAPIIAVFAAFLLGGILLALLDTPPLAVYYVFFIDPFTSAYNIAEVANKTATLAVIALGLSVGFRANVWNIGAEGQFTLGAIAATFVAVYFADAPFVLGWMFLAGACGGMAWGIIPAFLRNRWKINEILVSLMMVYIALLLLSYAVHGPLKDPKGYGFPQSPLFSENASLPTLITDTRLYASILLLPIAMLAIGFLLRKSMVGFEIQVGGISSAAAHYAGFNSHRPVWLAFLISGALAGVMGMVEVAGPFGQLTPVISPGYGFTAIIVAFLGKQTPIGIAAAAMLMSLIYIGGENAQIEMGLPPSISKVFQGLILFPLLAAEFFINHRIKFKKT